ncbi:hypothetical protein JCM19235_5007 [Vibrio maritimus]|uniref:Uncharacterized protein n=1 Tax=Vibrio maritimus TaxID=990268 RepID=A0A090S1E6_9VIBR|nr:hypothetical protein JCM19235_5007 [Vibrio maritimus]
MAGTYLKILCRVEHDKGLTQTPQQNYANGFGLQHKETGFDFAQTP